MSGRAPSPGDPGYTPNEMDFCACGATFQFDPRDPKKRKRFCPQCGKPEGKPRSFHERTGRPYANLLPPAWMQRLNEDQDESIDVEVVAVGDVLPEIPETPA